MVLVQMSFKSEPHQLQLISYFVKTAENRRSVLGRALNSLAPLTPSDASLEFLTAAWQRHTIYGLLKDFVSLLLNGTELILHG